MSEHPSHNVSDGFFKCYGCGVGVGDPRLAIECPTPDAVGQSRMKAQLREHRWSGWPGAWCLDCGCDDPREVALADHTALDEYGYPAVTVAAELMLCKESGSGRFDPYRKAEEVTSEFKPLTMSDIRLAAGEGALSAHDVLNAVNGILRARHVSRKAE